MTGLIEGYNTITVYTSIHFIINRNHCSEIHLNILVHENAFLALTEPQGVQKSNSYVTGFAKTVLIQR